MLRKEFDSKPFYNKEFLKTKIKAHAAEVIDFYDKTFPKVDYNDTCLAVINLDSALKKVKTIIQKLFLKCVNMLRKK